MKFTIKKNKIENIIEFLSNYVDSADSFTPFRCLFFKLNSTHLTITAQSSMISAKKEIKIDELNIKVEESGKFLINANILKNIIKKFNKTITFNSTDSVINIYEDTTNFTLTKISSEQYPYVDFNDQDNRTEVDSYELEKVIINSSISAVTSSDRLNALKHKCINISSEGDSEIQFVSTDSYRLSTGSLKVSKPVEINLSVDAKNLKKLVTKDSEKKVFLFFNDSKIGISYSDTIIQISTTNINYESIWHIFNFTPSRVIKLDKQDFLKLINKALFYNSEKTRRLQFSFTKSEVKIVYEVAEIGIGEASQSENYQLNGPELDIDIDFQYIKDAVSSLQNGPINILISEHEKFLLLVSEKTNTNRQIISPIRR